MKILIDIGHPGHVHLFRNFAHDFLEKGHGVLFTVREKEHEIELLHYENLPFIKIGCHHVSRPGKIIGLIWFNLRVLFISLKFKPDIYLSHGSVYTLLASLLLKKPNIALEDTGNLEQVRLYLPFTRAVLTAASFPFRYGAKQVFYNGYHELAYLHPDYFSPDPAVLKELGLAEGEKYFIVRFVAWQASHDRNNSGLGNQEKAEIVRYLSSRGRVFISAEAYLPEELEPYRLPLPPERLHHALSYATLFLGEGATMASESAILGTPAIYISTIRLWVLDEQERDYGIVTCFRSFDGVMDKINELLDHPGVKAETKVRSDRLINDKCDLTGFMIRFIERWPDSFGAADGAGR